ncbi:hypothetical protein PG994_011616 [Apiospora phragmitis]|uniref:Uncharacterized protein n=1 Tax=Apiospora phragmitis TaxID=2905665 RepID=A0ABR1TTA6_9PEZI
MPRQGHISAEECPLGERDFEVLGYAFLCIDGEFPAVDCRLLAGLAGFQSAPEAVQHWAAFKTKVKGFRIRPELGDINLRELQVAGYAWQCFPTSQIPEIKPKRLFKLGLYETQEQAAKAWDMIQEKLYTLEENDDSGPAGAAPAASAGPSPRVARTTPNKRNADQEGDGEAGSPAAKRRRVDYRAGT